MLSEYELKLEAVMSIQAHAIRFFIIVLLKQCCVRIALKIFDPFDFQPVLCCVNRKVLP